MGCALKMSALGLWVGGASRWKNFHKNLILVKRFPKPILGKRGTILAEMSWGKKKKTIGKMSLMAEVSPGHHCQKQVTESRMRKCWS